MHLFRRRKPALPAAPKPAPRGWIGGVKVNHPDPALGRNLTYPMADVVTDLACRVWPDECSYLLYDEPVANLHRLARRLRRWRPDLFIEVHRFAGEDVGYLSVQPCTTAKEN